MPQPSYEDFKEDKPQQQESEIIKEINVLEKRLAKIDNGLDRIAERIALICSAERPAETPQPPEPSAQSKLGLMIHVLSEKADDIHSKIHNIETRIKL